MCIQSFSHDYVTRVIIYCEMNVVYTYYLSILKRILNK